VNCYPYTYNLDRRFACNKKSKTVKTVTNQHNDYKLSELIQLQLKTDSTLNYPEAQK